MSLMQTFARASRGSLSLNGQPRPASTTHSLSRSGQGMRHFQASWKQHKPIVWLNEARNVQNFSTYTHQAMFRRHYSTQPDEKTPQPPIENQEISLIDKLIQGEQAKTSKWTVANIKAWLKSMPGAIRSVLAHYWMGTKLLWLNMKLSTKIVWRSLNGHKMTRRERRVLIRTTSDMFRLVPFAIILLVPFMEFALPILLKLFPNMLPSTFEDKLKQKESIKKQLKIKLEMAKFLQDTMKELTPADEGVEGDFEEFIKKLQNGELVHPAELIKFAKYFEDEMTLDGLERSQLVAMCKLLGASPFGTDGILRFQLRSRVNQIKRDDLSIREEGVDSLTLEELQQAVHARGMPGYNSNNIALLRRRLEDWLELSIDRNLPITLLVLSRAFALTARAGLEDLLRDTISTMPQDLIDEIELRVERSQNKVDRSLKLEVLNHYRELVEEEAEEAAQPKREGIISQQDVQQISEALSTLASPLILEKEELSELAKAAELRKSETKISAAVEEIKNIESDRKSAEREERERQELLRRQLQQEPGTKLPTAEELEKALAAERAREQKAKEERDREKQKQEKSVRRLESKVEELLEELKSEVESAQAALEEDLNIIDRNKDGLVSKDEIIYAFNVFKTKIPAEHIEKVVAKLDVDNDGLVPVEDLVKMAREFDFDLGDAILEQQKRDRVAIEKKKQRIEELQGKLQEHKEQDVIAPETTNKKEETSSRPTSTDSQ